MAVMHTFLKGCYGLHDCVFNGDSCKQKLFISVYLQFFVCRPTKPPKPCGFFNEGAETIALLMEQAAKVHVVGKIFNGKAV